MTDNDIKASHEETMSREALIREVNRLRSALSAEQAAKGFLLSAIDALPNPIFIKDQKGNFVFFNQVYAEFFGMDRQAYIGKNVLSLPFLPMEDRERYHREDLQLIERSELLHYEMDYTSASGALCPSFYWSSGFRSPYTGEKGLVGEIVNISKERELSRQLTLSIKQLEKANKTIAEASRIDSLTGIFNRSFLAEQEKLFMMGTVDRTVPLCLLMLDLDLFKRVNDEFGHLTGDHILANFAHILKSSCRDKDLPIRYGGEEFLIFLYDVDLPAARNIAERIRSKCARDLLLPNGEANTVSIGVSQYHPGQTLNECIEKADESLYRAKTTGRNRVVTEEQLKALRP